MPVILIWSGLIMLGLVVGAYGTMIGAGGGFVLVPLLLLIYPDDSPALLTSISLAVVFVNALSGSLAYLRQRRVDLLAANLFALATIPGAIAGALVVSLLPRRLFDLIFAVVLLLISAVLTAKPMPQSLSQIRGRRGGEIARTMTDAAGETYMYAFDPRLGIALSVLVGFVSSLLGIGGGIIHVPILVLVLHFPTHIATATSHYVLSVSAGTGTAVHLLADDLPGGLLRTALLSVGVFVGAQIGAKLSSRVKGETIVRLLGVALGAVGARLLLASMI